MIGIKLDVESVDKGLEDILRRANALVEGRYVKVGVRNGQRQMTKSMRKALRGLKGKKRSRAKVALQAKAIDNVQLAIIHEFGSSDGRIPERSFMRSTFDDKKKKYIFLLTRAARTVLALDKAHQERREKLSNARGSKKLLAAYKKFEPAARAELVRELALLGEVMVSDIKDRILSGEGIPPPNAPSTIERKGSSRPLVDTGQLVNSISYSVVKGAEPEASEEG